MYCVQPIDTCSSFYFLDRRYLSEVIKIKIAIKMLLVPENVERGVGNTAEFPQPGTARGLHRFWSKHL